jgi:hypothetical protein
MLSTEEIDESNENEDIESDSIDDNGSESNGSDSIKSSESDSCERSDSSQSDGSDHACSGSARDSEDKSIVTEVELTLAEVLDEVARCQESRPEPAPEPASCCIWCLKVRFFSNLFTAIAPCICKLKGLPAAWPTSTRSLFGVHVSPTANLN